MLVDAGRVITPELLVRNPCGEVARIAKIRVVGDWPHQAGAPPPEQHDFADDAEEGSSLDEPYTPGTGWSGLTRTSTSRTRPPRCNFSGTAPQRRDCQALGACLYPSVPLWTFAARAFSALARALSLAGVPAVMIRELPTPARPRTPPPQLAPLTTLDDAIDVAPPPLPRASSLGDLLEEEGHESCLRKRRARRKRAKDNAGARGWPLKRSPSTRTRHPRQLGSKQ